MLPDSLISASEDAERWARAHASASRRPTVDLSAIAELLKARIVRRDSWADRAHGALGQSSDGTWIVSIPANGVSTGPLSPRERFTVAHELAHILLAQRGIGTPSERREYWQLESACNRIAGALLVPDWAIPAGLVEGSAGLRWVKWLQRHCTVSFPVAATEALEGMNNVVGAATVDVRNADRLCLRFAVGIFPHRGTVLKGGDLHDFARSVSQAQTRIADVTLAGTAVVAAAQRSAGHIEVVALDASPPALRTRSGDAAGLEDGGRALQLSLFNAARSTS